MKYIPFIFLFSISILAQKPKINPVGEYNLTGEREIACGFLLNADSTFQFYLSYGAMDRQGVGRWQVAGNQVLLNSTEKSKQNFKPESEKKTKENTIKIKLAKANPDMYNYVHALLIANGQTSIEKMNEDGEVVFPMAKADTIKLVFDWCPDRITVFPIKNSKNNTFSFSPLPNIMDVVFDQFKMHITRDEMMGPLSFFDEKVLHFRKRKE